MTAISERMPAVAPGEWLLERDADGAEIVSVTFPRGRDLAVIREQLASWRAAVAECIGHDSVEGVEAALLLPALVENQRSASPVSLRYAAPLHSGTGLLSPARTRDELFALLRRVAVALDVLHSRSFVHGALGVESLWEMHDGSLRFPDAGLTHVLDRVVDAPVVAGAYLAPEVWRGSGMLAASDQYSLAVIVVELFTGRGRLVQDAEGMLSIAPLALESDERLYPGAPASLTDVLQRALATAPAARFPSCVAFIDALQGEVQGVTSLETVHGFRSQRTSVWSVQTLVLGLVAAGSIVGAGFAVRAGVKGRRVTRPAPAAPVAASNRLAAPPLMGQRAVPRAARGAPGTGQSIARTAAADPPESSLIFRTRIAAAAPAPPSTQRTGVGGKPITAANSALSAPPRPRSQGRAGGLEQDSASARSRNSLDSAQAASSSAGREAVSPRTSAAPPAGNVVSTRVLTPAPGALPGPTPERPGAAGNAPGARAGVPDKRVGPPVDAGPATGVLRVSGLPGSRYYVDGVLVRPKKGLITVPEGVHDISIVHPNRGSERRRVTVHRGETVVIGR